MSEAQDPVLRGDQMLASGGEWRREIWHTQGVFRRKRVEKGDLSTESAPSAGERVGTDTRPRPTALSGKCQLSAIGWQAERSVSTVSNPDRVYTGVSKPVRGVERFS